MSGKLTHFNDQGRAKMVDVSAKEPTLRIAVARGTVLLNRETFQLVEEGRMKKGDVLAVAQVAGIMAAKRNSELIPMCHPIALLGIDIAFELDRRRIRSISSRRSGARARRAWRWRRLRRSPLRRSPSTICAKPRSGYRHQQHPPAIEERRQKRRICSNRGEEITWRLSQQYASATKKACRSAPSRRYLSK